MNIDKEREIISDDGVELVHGSADFGDMKKRDVIRSGLLKCVCGYANGSTSEKILKKHKLINAEGRLTFKGRKYLWVSFFCSAFERG